MCSLTTECVLLLRDRVADVKEFVGVRVLDWLWGQRAVGRVPRLAGGKKKSGLGLFNVERPLRQTRPIANIIRPQGVPKPGYTSKHT